MDIFKLGDKILALHEAEKDFISKHFIIKCMPFNFKSDSAEF